MHEDPAGGSQPTVGELTGLLAALILTDSYYCDQGSHHGRTRVLLDGYLTDRQVSLLRTARRHPAGDAGKRGELDTYERAIGAVDRTRRGHTTTAAARPVRRRRVMGCVELRSTKRVAVSRR